ncbi:hypothetical protein [Mariniluteicoccus flavus]
MSIAHPSRPPRARFALPRAAWIGLLAALALATAWQCWRVGVNQDVRQVAGVLRGARAGGFGVADAWAHRPLASRLVMGALGLALPSDPVGADRVLRVVCSLLAALAAAVLGHGLRGPLGRQGAGFVALAVGAALVVAPAWDFAEPEWFAAVGAAAAIGVAFALGPRTGAGLAGVLLAGVGLLKYTTVTVAVVAVACVWVLDHRRGRWLALATGAATVALFGVSLLVSPHEWQWLRDMPLLNPPLTGATALRVVEGWSNHVLVSPLTLVGITALTDLAFRGRARLALAGLAGLIVLAVPFAVQHQGFLYHLAPLPVFAAGATAALLALGVAAPSGAARVHRTWLAVAVGGTVIGVLVFAAGPRTRDGLWWIGLALTVVAIVLPVVAVFAGNAWDRASGGRMLPLAVAPLLLVPLLVALSPRTAYSVSMAHDRVTPAVNRQQAVDARALAGRVAAVVPPDAPVVHLGFNTPWQLPNPSTCRYVSPTFLQRASLRGVRASASFRENLACLDDPRARFAVIEKGWFDLDRVPAPVAEAVRRNFPCARPVYEDATVRVCGR